MPRQPLAHLWVLVGRIIVDDGMDHFPPGDLLLDRVEEADELLVAMMLHVAANDGAIEDVRAGFGWVEFGISRMFAGPRVYSYEELVRTIARRADCGRC